MGIKRNKKRLAAAAIAFAGLAGGAAAVSADTFSDSVGSTAAPTNWPAIAPTCTSSPCNITLEAGVGSVTVADDIHGSTGVPFLGFGVNGADVALAGSPNSTIKVPVGTTINITLTQTGISDPIDLSFPSLPIGSVTGGAGSFTVDANTVGTMVFQPGLNADAPKQIAQGLVGVLIVTPAACTDPELKCAYDGTAYEDEALIATTDLDLEFALDPGSFDMGYFGQSIDPDFSDRQVYHFINGKSFPDTDVIEVRADDDVLLRYVNAGVTDKAMGSLGVRQSLLARNASAYTDAQTVISPLIGPGETADVAVKIPVTAISGQFYSIVDSGRQMNGGTATGFGGALTFLNVRDADAPIAPLAIEEPTGDTATPTDPGIAGAGDVPTGDTTGDTTPPATGDTTPKAGGISD